MNSILKQIDLEITKLENKKTYIFNDFVSSFESHFLELCNEKFKKSYSYVGAHISNLNDNNISFSLYISYIHTEQPELLTYNFKSEDVQNVASRNDLITLLKLNNTEEAKYLL
jgi:hypothetical protein